MAFLSHINGSDIASLVQNIYFPAVQNDPLYQVMFPGNLQDDQRNDIIKWYYIGMQRAFNSRTTFYKACTDDGTAVGFAGWVLEEPTHNSVTQTKSKEETVLLQTLDVNAWQDVSRALMKERRRVLDSLENVLRLTFMYVRPDHQKQGVGSTMMERICEEADQHCRYLYVLASPVGVRLYSKFDFKTVGQINTENGVITSMLRESR